MRVCADSSDPSLIDPFFDMLRQVDIQVVLHFVDLPCHFKDVLTHILHCFSKQEADARP
jgi:hypothetical protein